MLGQNGEKLKNEVVRKLNFIAEMKFLFYADVCSTLNFLIWTPDEKVMKVFS